MADEQLVGMSKAELAEILDSVFDQASSSSGEASAFSEIPSLAGALGEIDRVLDGDDRPYTLRFTGLVFHAEAWTSRHTNSFVLVLVLRETARSVWFVPLSHVREFSEHTPGPLVRRLDPKAEGGWRSGAGISSLVNPRYTARRPTSPADAGRRSGIVVHQQLYGISGALARPAIDPKVGARGHAP